MGARLAATVVNNGFRRNRGKGRTFPGSGAPCLVPAVAVAVTVAAVVLVVGADIGAARGVRQRRFVAVRLGGGPDGIVSREYDLPLVMTRR